MPIIEVIYKGPPYARIRVHGCPSVRFSSKGVARGDYAMKNGIRIL